MSVWGGVELAERKVWYNGKGENQTTDKCVGRQQQIKQKQNKKKINIITTSRSTASQQHYTVYSLENENIYRDKHKHIISIQTHTHTYTETRIK